MIFFASFLAPLGEVGSSALWAFWALDIAFCASLFASALIFLALAFASATSFAFFFFASPFLTLALAVSLVFLASFLAFAFFLALSPSFFALFARNAACWCAF